MVYILYAIFFLSCLVLVGSVLLQPGKTDAGALFTSNVSSSAFAPRGTATVLSKITIAAAVAFMLSALLLAMPALNGNISVLSANPEAPAESNSNANTDTNSVPTTPDANPNTSVPSADNSSGVLIGNTEDTQAVAANAATTANTATNKAAPKKSPASSNKK